MSTSFAPTVSLTIDGAKLAVDAAVAEAAANQWKVTLMQTLKTKANMIKKAKWPKVNLTEPQTLH